MSYIKDIQIRSKGAAAKFTSDLPWAAISIVTQPNTWPKLAEENRHDVLQMYFWDITVPNIQLVSPEYLFDEEKAGVILDFAEKVWDKIDVLLVHCEMGMSRSPAIGASLAYCYHGPQTDKEFFNRYTPNCHVYDTILQTYFKRRGEEPPAPRNKHNPLLPGENEEILTEPWNPLD